MIFGYLQPTKHEQLFKCKIKRDVYKMVYTSPLAYSLTVNDDDYI